MDERQRVIHELAEDLEVARACALLAFRLRAMILDGSHLVRIADDFAWLTLRALRDSAVIHLWKAYDTQRQARSLAWFIRTHSPAAKSVVDQDLDRLSAKQPDVARLRELRHQVFAHRGEATGRQSSDQLLQMHNLSEPEFLNMVEDARAILRRHSGSPLPRALPHRADDALHQLAEVSAYLHDALPSRWGLERFVPEIDGAVKGRSRSK